MSNSILILFTLAIFLIEGLGFSKGREIVYFLILALPWVLYFFDFSTNKKIVIPRLFALVSLVFFLLLIVSTVLSLNIQRSFEYLLLLSSYFLVFIYAYNHKEAISKVIAVIVALSVAFSIYSVSLDFFLTHKWYSFIPSSGYNLVYPTNSAHNHLGDFLVLPLIISLYFLFRKKNVFFHFCSLIFFLPFLIFSYSRSAYLSLILALVSMFLYTRKSLKLGLRQTVIWLFIICATLIFFISTVQESKKTRILYPFHQFLTKKSDLRSKYFFANRDKYFGQAINSMIKNPWFGVGPGNFVISSKHYAKTPQNWSYSSHNVFLDIFSESGIFAGILFVGMVAFIIKKSEKKMLFFLFLALLINFQTDYAHTIYSLLFLFFLLGGTIYKEKQKLDGMFLIVLGLAIFVLIQSMVLSKILFKNKHYNLAFLTYPFSAENYPKLIEDQLAKGNAQKAFYYVSLYEKFFSGDPAVLNYIGVFHLRYGNPTIALSKFKKAYYIFPFDVTNLYRKIYDLEELVNGKTAAKGFANTFFRNLQDEKGKIIPLGLATFDIEWFCWQVYGKCPYKFQ